MDFLICRPDHYGIDYEINPHMDVEKQSCPKESLAQWNLLVDAIHRAGGAVTHIEPQPELPDMVFTANAGLMLDSKRVVLSKFKHTERQGEEKFFEDFFVSRDIEVIKAWPHFEGAGDALFFNGRLIGAYGFRTAAPAYRCIEEHGVPVSRVRLTDPHFYHLDTCFCPLRDRDYLINPSAFDPDSLSRIRSLGEREVCVSEEEAHNFACNAVLVNDTVILPEGCPNAVEKLVDFGYKADCVPMTEFLKSGGACKCLTLRLD